MALAPAHVVVTVLDAEEERGADGDAGGVGGRGEAAEGEQGAVDKGGEGGVVAGVEGVGGVGEEGGDRGGAVADDGEVWPMLSVELSASGCTRIMSSTAAESL